jgi:hypothetical protein
MSHSLKVESSVPNLGGGVDKAWNVTRHFVKLQPPQTNWANPNCESPDKIILEKLNSTNLHFPAMAPSCSPRHSSNKLHTFCTVIIRNDERDNW